MEMTPHPEEDEVIILANTKLVINRSWALAEDDEKEERFAWLAEGRMMDYGIYKCRQKVVSSEV